MTPKRQWAVPTDRMGPQTKAQGRISRRGLGASLVLHGNPFSFDLLRGCLPFVNLEGGQDPASDQVRDTQTFAGGLFEFGASVFGPNTTTTPPADPGKPAPGSTTTTPAAPSPTGTYNAPTTGPFGYIGLADQKKKGK